MKIHKRSKYRVLYAYPPWPKYGGGKIRRGGDRHFLLMLIAAIVQLGEIANGWNVWRNEVRNDFVIA